ncbi:reverse transcriptase domain-containing protein, partial [Tanacetum coccineum]
YDDDDTDDEDEEPFQDEDDGDEEEEHLASTDSSAVPIIDPVPSTGDTKTVILEPPMSPSMEARIAEYAAAPALLSLLPSPLSTWSPPLSQIPLPPLPPLPPALHLPPLVSISLPLPSSPLPPLPVSLFIPPPVNHREDIPKAELPPRKRLCPTAPTLRYEVGESSTAAPRPTGGHRADYGFIGTTDAEIRRRRAEEVGYGIRDVWVDPTEAVEEVAPTTLEGVNARVTELAAVQEQDTQDVYAVIEDTQDRQTQLFQSVDGLVEDRHFHYETARLLDREALVSREAWAHSVGLSLAVHYELQAYRTHTQMQDYRIASQESLMTTLIAQVSSLQGQLSAALGQIQALQARDQTHADDHEGADNHVCFPVIYDVLYYVMSISILLCVVIPVIIVPPRRAPVTRRAPVARRAPSTRTANNPARNASTTTDAPMSVAAINQLIETRVAEALANQEQLRNSGVNGDGSQNSRSGTERPTRTPRECTYKDFLNCHPLNFKGTEGVVVLSQWFEKMESVFHISNCAPENQVKFATCTFIGNALTWWNSHKKAVTQDVAYAMDWKALKKMMTVKYCPRGEIKKLEIELWNLKVKGTDIPSYTLRFQELALMCGRMFPEESDEVEKYVSGLPDMIRGNVMSYRPQTMEEVIEFANDQMNQKLITISERQAE